MCLITFAYRTHPDYPLIVAANRDEYFNRATAPLGHWQDFPDIVAGRDLEAGGTWMGITTGGRFAALTNYRDPARERPEAPSRGQLVSDFLKSETSVEDSLISIERSSGQFNGFNLLVFDGDDLGYLSNASDSDPVILRPGIYGLSNHLLDTPWPKVQRARQRLRILVAENDPDTGQMFYFLRNTDVAEDENLPSTGVPLNIERALSAAFIGSPGYGTRSSTIMMYGKNGKILAAERTFDDAGGCTGSRTSQLEISDQR